MQLLFANPFHLASFLAALHELDKVTMSVVSLDFDYDDVFSSEGALNVILPYDYPATF